MSKSKIKLKKNRLKSKFENNLENDKYYSAFAHAGRVFSVLRCYISFASVFGKLYAACFAVRSPIKRHFFADCKYLITSRQSAEKSSKLSTACTNFAGFYTSVGRKDEDDDDENRRGQSTVDRPCEGQKPRAQRGLATNKAHQRQ
jgi:hypothetical protein